MRGKLAQENILDTFGEKEIYASYLIGELHCEELDADGDSDIATSSRQALKQDDPRFEALRRIVKTELRHVAGKWSDWRRRDGAKAAAKVPAVSDWLDNLSASTRKKAERWIGRLNTIRSEDETVKKELLKASILAFESYRRKEELEQLDNVTDESLDKVLDIFRSIDELELSYYGQIVQGRSQGHQDATAETEARPERDGPARLHLRSPVASGSILGTHHRLRAFRDLGAQILEGQYEDAQRRAETGSDRYRISNRQWQARDRRTETRVRRRSTR